MSNDGVIGIYDSGIGGFTVLNPLIQSISGENIVYFADSGNLPYGEKTAENITNFSKNIINWLSANFKIKAILIACHTSSSIAFQDLKNKYDFPIIDIITPFVNEISNNTAQYKDLCIFSTVATANSKVHKKLLMEKGYANNIHLIGCPKFTPIIESGINAQNLAELKNAIREYGSVIEENNIKTLIHGCTHYPFIEEYIKEEFPNLNHIINPAQYIIEKFFEKTNIKNIPSKMNEGKNNNIHFYTTGDLIQFTQQIQRFIECKNYKITKLYLNEIHL